MNVKEEIDQLKESKEPPGKKRSKTQGSAQGPEKTEILYLGAVCSHETGAMIGTRGVWKWESLGYWPGSKLLVCF